MQQITRKTARELGLKTYSLPGCKFHPTSERYTKSGLCRLCAIGERDLRRAIQMAKIEDSEPYYARMA